MPKRPIKPRWFPSPPWARGTRRWRPRPSKRGGRPPPSLGVYRLMFFVLTSVELGLQAFGVLFVIVLCVGCVLAVAAGREVAVGRRTARAGIRIPQLGAYEGLRAVIERFFDRDPHHDAGQLALHLAPLQQLGVGTDGRAAGDPVGLVGARNHEDDPDF